MPLFEAAQLEGCWSQRDPVHPCPLSYGVGCAFSRPMGKPHPAGSLSLLASAQMGQRIVQGCRKVLYPSNTRTAFLSCENKEEKKTLRRMKEEIGRLWDGEFKQQLP